MAQVIACYDNFDILTQLQPDFKNLEWKAKVTDTKGLLYGHQAMPWPMAARELMVSCTGFVDQENKAFISVSETIYPGEKYFDYTVEPVAEGLVALKCKMGYNFFQYLGPNKTRHLAIWNTDP